MTDHISLAGNIKELSPVGVYLKARGVKVADFNSLGARRGNHQVMMREEHLPAFVFEMR